MALFQPDPWLDAFVEASYFSFEWDSGNRFKNWRRHGITSTECEEVFLNGALPVGIQVAPATIESRYAVVGETWERKPLFVVFTPREAMRQTRVRVISARLTTRQEREDYDLLR